MSGEARHGRLPLGRQGLQPQLIHQAREHALLEGRKARPRQPVVERLVAM
jgi:hypothetical protein